MATAILTRSDRAVGIVTRQECIPCEDHPGFFQVRDTETGSGTTYIAAAHRCTCPDYIMRGQRCKHSIAVEHEERALADYCTDWNARSEQARAALTPEDLDWLADDVARDEYAGPFGADGWPQPRPCCPECGAELVSRSYYVGGKGYTAFLCCTKDSEHRALPA